MFEDILQAKLKISEYGKNNKQSYDYAFFNQNQQKFTLTTQAPQAQNTWCMRQVMYIENCMGKSPIVKKLCK